MSNDRKKENKRKKEICDGRKRTAKSYQRPVGKLNERKRILILCEGTKTEPQYFDSFEVSSIHTVDIEGLGINTKQIVAKAVSMGKEAAQNNESYDEIWCVFDRDSFPKEHFNAAFSMINHKMARELNIKIAHSNEAFELWYLLHFSFLHSGLSRSQYCGKLSKFLGFKYKKNDSQIYSYLEKKMDDAIRNAQLLYSYYPDPCTNPSTTVFKLVELLRSLQEIYTGL